MEVVPTQPAGCVLDCGTFMDCRVHWGGRSWSCCCGNGLVPQSWRMAFYRIRHAADDRRRNSLRGLVSCRMWHSCVWHFSKKRTDNPNLQFCNCRTVRASVYSQNVTRIARTKTGICFTCCDVATRSSNFLSFGKFGWKPTTVAEKRDIGIAAGCHVLLWNTSFILDEVVLHQSEL